jgi:large subunit ribosomal protein L29
MKIAGQLREIRESSDEELKVRLLRLEEEFFGHRMKRFANQLANVMRIRQTRREIARVKTILSARAGGKEHRAKQGTSEARQE